MCMQYAPYVGVNIIRLSYIYFPEIVRPSTKFMTFYSAFKLYVIKHPLGSICYRNQLTRGKNPIKVFEI